MYLKPRKAEATLKRRSSSGGASMLQAASALRGFNFVSNFTKHLMNLNLQIVESQGEAELKKGRSR
jgi:hypothetical protein